jgi:ADP-ribose pyrophosphatase YjhB (NUDIX family)
MYEVFIDKKKILFTDSTQNLNNFNYPILTLDFLKVKNYQDFLEGLPPSDCILIVCKHKEKAWQKFVDQFEFIEAAGGIVTFEDSFLAIFRNEKWDLPKGKLEKNENPVLGAMREIQEECGVSDMILVNEICNTFHTYEFNENPVLKKTYWYHFRITKKQELIPQIEEGITVAAWMKKNNKQTFLENTFESIKEVLCKFEKSLH